MNAPRRRKQGFGTLSYASKQEAREMAAFEARKLPSEGDPPEVWNPYTRTPVATIALDEISYDDWNPKKAGFRVTSRP